VCDYTLGIGQGGGGGGATSHLRIDRVYAVNEQTKANKQKSLTVTRGHLHTFPASSTCILPARWLAAMIYIGRMRA